MSELKERKLKGAYKVSQSNKLITARQQNPLNVFETRLILSMVSTIQPNDTGFLTQRVSVKEFCALLNYSEPSYTKVKQACDSLLTKSIHIMKPEGAGWLKSNWVSSAEYFEGMGEIEFVFSPRLSPYLLQLKGDFTSYELGYTLLLQSTYSIKLYELAKKCEGSQNYKPVSDIYSLEELRLILGAISPSHQKYSCLKQRVLTPAVKEINEKTDLEVELKEIKKGHKVVGIQFAVKPKLNTEKEKLLTDLKKRKHIRSEALPESFKEHRQEQVKKDKEREQEASHSSVNKTPEQLAQEKEEMLAVLQERKRRKSEPIPEPLSEPEKEMREFMEQF